VSRDPRTPLGRDLRGLRQRAGLLQAELAARLGCSRAHVSAVEVGQRLPSEPLARLWRIVCERRP